MNIICPKCGEPWDFDSLHDVAEERYGISYYLDGENFHRSNRVKNPEYNGDDYDRVFQEVSKEFRSKGCGIVFDKRPCTTVDSDRTAMASAAYEILGDDLDGAASMFDDYGL
jgi:hypothetical protein